jgi:SAM-dependent methyltransferase
VPRLRSALARLRKRRRRPLDFGAFSRTRPFDRDFGFGRGEPVDRVYIERFLAGFGASSQGGSGAIRGRVLEIGDDLYSSRFGGDAVERVDVLDVSAANTRADFVADLADAPELPANAFDCVICTQTLLLIWDVDAALGTLHRVLRPGGTLLVTVPGISQGCRSGDGRWEDYWRFTQSSLRRLVGEEFGPDAVTVRAFGNVKTAASFLYGLAAGDLDPNDFLRDDPDYPVIVAASAVKAPK